MVVRSKTQTGSKRRTTAEPAAPYFAQLEAQIEINKDQLYELRSLLRVERFKIAIYLTFILIVVVVALAIGVAVAHGGIDYKLEHLAALVNIGAVFVLFGLFELLTFLTESLSLTTKLRRLVMRQHDALSEAFEELAQRPGS